MPATRELVTVSTKRQVQGCGGPEGEQAEEGPWGAEAAEQEQGVRKGSLSPVRVPGVCKDLLVSFSGCVSWNWLS